MAEEKMIRLGQASRKLNVGHNTILDFLAKKGFTVENNPNAKLTADQFAMLSKEFASSASEKIEASILTIGNKHTENLTIQNEPSTHRKKTEEDDSVLIKNLGSKEIKGKEEVKQPEKVEREKAKLEGIKVLGKIDLDKKPKSTPKEEAPKKKEKEKEPVAVVPPPPVVEPEKEKVVAPPEQELIKAKADKLQGLKVLDRIDLPVEKKSSAESKEDERKKRPRKRIPSADNKGGGVRPGAAAGPGR
ncbi:MAG TPA: translation initiation factor IF-2, partial [Cyclobacteriaceae bacterium]|nr:translation initiation factor IF-2 [Cyclobacteriaceae bacterium]